MEKAIENLNTAKLILCNQKMLTPEMCIRIGQAITSAIALLKEQQEEIENLKQTAQSMMEGVCLLKEQEAVPVDVCGHISTVKYGHCPKCNEGLNSEVYPHWCGYCGQAVKWE